VCAARVVTRWTDNLYNFDVKTLQGVLLRDAMCYYRKVGQQAVPIGTTEAKGGAMIRLVTTERIMMIFAMLLLALFAVIILTSS
jgi:hypothetical protein